MNQEISVAALEELVGMTTQWLPAFSDRAFYFDAFISHNSEDAFAQSLAELLRQSGARVWCNESDDMRSKRVVERITRAIYFSRYVLVCVGEKFRDSPWVKAEYLNALRAEKEAGGTRVLVVSPADSPCLASVPDVLKGLVRHSIVRAADATSLARKLTSGNRIPTDSICKHGQYPDRSASWSWLQQAGEAIGSEESRCDYLRALASALDAKADSDYLMLARLGICRASFSELKALDTYTARFLFEAAKWFSLSTSDYQRANGLMILGQLDTTGLWPEARTLLFDALARESHEGVIRELWEWMSTIEDSQLPQHLGALTHAALVGRSPYVGSGPFARFRPMLPEAVRMRLAVRSVLDLGVLGVVERAQLCFGRIDFLHGNQSNDDEPDYLSYDIELTLGELRALLTEVEGKSETEEGSQVEEYLVLTSERIADMWEGSRAAKMHALAVCTPYYLAAPLLWAGRHSHLRSRAQHAHARICDAIQKVDERSRFAAELRSLLERYPYIDKHELDWAASKATLSFRG